MPLNEQQKKSLIARYIDRPERIELMVGEDTSDARQNKQALEQALNFIANHIDPYFMPLPALASEDPITQAAYQQEWQALKNLLDKATGSVHGRDRHQLVFNSQAAMQAVEAFNRQINRLPTRFYHDQISNYTLRQKCLRGLAFNQHWLTDLDLKVLIAEAGLTDQLRVTSLVGGHADLRAVLQEERKKHQEGSSGEPYKIHLLVALPSTFKTQEAMPTGTPSTDQGNHWVAVTVNVDPNQHTLHYQLEDSLAITPTKRDALQVALRDAFHTPDTEGNVAFEQSQWTVTGNLGSSVNLQRDGYSCGYRAFHYLINQLEDMDTPQLRHFKEDFESSTALAQRYQEAILRNVCLQKATYQTLAESFKDQFIQGEDGYTLRPECLPQIVQSGQLALRVSTARADANVSPGVTTKAHPNYRALSHEAVSEVISTISASTRVLSFPKDPSANVTALETHHFLEELASTLASKRLSPINKLKFNATNETVDGLLTFLATKPSELPFKRLEITLAPNLNKAQLLALIQNLEGLSFEGIVVEDPNNVLTQQTIEDVLVQTRDHGVITTITLPPPWQTHPMQRALDDQITLNRQHRNQLKLRQPSMATQLPKASHKNRTPRTRSSGSAATNLSIEIEVEQEQEQQHNIEQQQELSLELTSGLDKDLSVEDGSALILTAEGFMSAIENGTLKIPQHYKLLSQEQLKAIWSTLCGAVNLPHPLPPATPNYTMGFSTAALVQLLKTTDAAHVGFDFSHLPQGLILDLDTKTQQYVFKYDLALNKYDSPFSPTKSVSATSPLMSAHQVKQLIDGVNDASAKEKLSELWHTLTHTNYDRQHVTQFKQCLPDLLQLPPTRIGELLDLCRNEEDSSVNLKALQFVLEHQEKIKQTFKEASSFTNSDSNREIARNALRQLFRDDAAIQTIITILHEEKTPHCLAQCLTSEKASQVASFIAKTQANNHHCQQGFYHLWLSHGEEGVNHFLETYENLTDRSQHAICKTLLNQGRDFDLVWSDSRYQKTLERIEKLPDQAYQWWQQLLDKHCLHHKEADLIELFQSFEAFYTALSTKGLSLPDLSKLENPFSGLTDMKVAMGNMLALLDKCKKEDLTKQWEAIPKLSFDKEGGFPFMLYYRYPDALQTNLVLPEMQINGKDDPAVTEGYTLTHWKAIKRASTEQELDKLFYRYIAVREPRLPLATYKNMLAYLKKTDGKEKFTSLEQRASLYAWLAESTTRPGSEEMYLSAEADWQRLVDSFDKPTSYSRLSGLTARMVQLGSAYVRDTLFSQITALPYVPNLKQLTDINVQLITYMLGDPNLSMSAIKARGDTLKATQGKLIHILTVVGRDNDWRTSPFDGMKHYQDEEYGQDSELFIHHIDACAAIESQIGEKILFRENVCAAMFKLTSVFHLNKVEEPTNYKYLETSFVNLFHFENCFEEAWHRGDTKFLVNCLLHINPTKRADNGELFPELSSQDLGDFLVECTAEIFPDEKIKDKRSAIINKMKEKFGARFPDHFFDQFERCDFSAQLQAKLKANIPTVEHQQKIRTIFNKFQSAGEDRHYPQLLDAILYLYKATPPEQQGRLVDYLSNPQLLTPSEGTVCAITDLIELCEQAKEQSGTLLYFFNKMDVLATSAGPSNLMLKAHLYMCRLLPDLKEATQTSNLGRTQAIDPIIELLNASDTSSLQAAPIPEVSTPELQQAEANKNALATIDQDTLSGTENSEALQATRQLVEGILTTPSIAANTRDQLQTLKRQLEARIDALNQPASVTAPLESATAEETTVMPTAKPNAFWRATSTIISWFTQSKSQPQTPVAASMVSEPQTTAPAPRSLPSIDSDLIQQAIRNQAAYIETLQQYAAINKTLFTDIYQTCKRHAGAKDLIIDLYKHYLRAKPEEVTASSQIGYAWQQINTARALFDIIDNTDLIRTLCFYFNQAERQPTELIELAQKVEHLEDDKKRFFIHLACALLTNDKPFRLTELENVISFCGGEQGEAVYEALQEIYEQMPCPTLAQVTSWVREVEQAGGLTKDGLLQKYDTFDKKPCPREHQGAPGIPAEDINANGFVLVKAEQQLKQMSGILYVGQGESAPADTDALIITQAELLALDEQIRAVRAISTKDLVTEFQRFKTLPESEQNHQRLLAITAELLYRAKGKSVGDTPQLGKSFEIHTTQYLALYTMLKSGGRITSQIGTGEGKSRIMMLAVACQHALGNTVDFVTADVQLATRDYLSFQPFFNLLGAKTNLISKSSRPEEYQQGGINFSDPANLSLFRNIAISEGKADLVVESDPNKRALLLDEADATYFDASDTRYSYSTQADRTLADMKWVYPLLVEFFEDDTSYNGQTSRELYVGDIDQCNENFLDFVERHPNGGEQRANKLRQNISSKQLELWHDGAMAARNLRFDEHYTVNKNVPLLSDGKIILGSEAKLLVNNVMSDSKYSFGVHQCLHARINRVLEKKSLSQQLSIEEQENIDQLKKALGDDALPCPVDSEKQIIYTSTSKTLLDTYQQGHVLAVTGTAGSIKEREEAKTYYSSNDGSRPMHFVDIPRHRGLKRIDHAVQLTRDDAHQVEYLVKQIKAAKLNQQPLVIFCENDDKSRALYQAISAHPELKSLSSDSITRVDASTSTKALNHYVEEQAGQPGHITIATDRIGRGTDITLHGEAKSKGLNVLLTYLPRERDMLQILGRAGRFGAEGEARLILNKEDMLSTYSSDEFEQLFYTQGMTYLRELQASIDKQQQAIRLFKQELSHFRDQYERQFFQVFMSDLLASPDIIDGDKVKKELLGQWKLFFDATDKAGNALIKEFSENRHTLGTEQLQIKIDEYNQLCANAWRELATNVEHIIKEQDIEQNKLSHLTFEDASVPHLSLSAALQKIVTEQNQSSSEPLKQPVRIFNTYDPAHNGRVIFYDNWWTALKARVYRLFNSEAHSQGIGYRAPYWTAWRKGKISFWEMVTGVASKDRDILDINKPTSAEEQPAQDTLPQQEVKRELNADSEHHPAAVSGSMIDSSRRILERLTEEGGTPPQTAIYQNEPEDAPKRETRPEGEPMELEEAEKEETIPSPGARS